MKNENKRDMKLYNYIVDIEDMVKHQNLYNLKIY